MTLNKRDCGINVHIEPIGANMLYVLIDFGYEKVEFTPSSAVGEQFGALISAVYSLYFEGCDCHNDYCKRETCTNKKSEILSIASKVAWDGEGPEMIIKMERNINQESNEDIIIFKISTDYEKTYRTIYLNGRDFCYALAKAYTKVLKAFGFYGYHFSTEFDCIDVHQFLFIKAYGLGNMEARTLTYDSENCWGRYKSDFNKEIELLLFDM